MLPELNVIVLELAEIALWSALALVVGGILVLLGVVGMALGLVLARNRPRRWGGRGVVP